MKIRSRWIIKVVGFVAAWVVRWWIDSCTFRLRTLGPNVDPYQRELSDRYIFAVWHHTLLVPVCLFSRANMWVLVSHHADGELLGEVGRHLRLKLVRGSSRRGGLGAVRKLLRIGRSAHLAITPDGPSGPRGRVQKGVVYLASRTGLPIVPVGFGYRRAWRTRSWDRMVVPWPGSLVTAVAGAPLHVPAATSEEQLARYCAEVETCLGQLTELAQRWNERGGRGPYVVLGAAKRMAIKLPRSNSFGSGFAENPTTAAVESLAS
jgi:lysophospholipid acyltransferase (LPLAT)-like uncharacterized protein